MDDVFFRCCLGMDVGVFFHCVGECLLRYLEVTNSKTSSRPSEWGTVPKTQLAFPLWMAMEMLCERKKVDLLSPVASFTFCPMALISLRPSGPQEPNVSTPIGTKQ